MSGSEEITKEMVLSVVDYEPETGMFRWKARMPDPSLSKYMAAKTVAWNTRYAGKPAGSVFKKGYHVLELYGRKLFAHRVAFLVTHGFWAKEDVDHINGIRTDNRASNLRSVTRSQNLQNTHRLRSNNTSGVKGVSFRSDTGKWTVRIREFNGKSDGGKYTGKYHCFGSYSSLEEASAVAETERKRLHGDYAKHVDTNTKH